MRAREQRIRDPVAGRGVGKSPPGTSREGVPAIAGRATAAPTHRTAARPPTTLEAFVDALADFRAASNAAKDGGAPS